MIAAHALMGTLLAATISVEGGSGCPDARQVEDRLRPLLPRDAAASSSDVVRLTREGQDLIVTVERADGTLVGTRRLTGKHDCAGLAEAVAVIVASWQVDGALRERTPALPDDPTPPRPPPEPAARNRQPPRPAVALVASGPVRPAHDRWDLAAGAGMGLAGADVEPALVLSATAWWPRSFGVSARAAGGGERETALDAGGAVVWRRTSFLVGPVARGRLGPLRIEGHLAGGVAWLSIEGRGLANARRHDDAHGVGLGAVRLSLDRGPVSPWLEVGGLAWPARARVYALPAGAGGAADPAGAQEEGVPLPRLELVIALGLAVRL